jgi:aminopeptidase 2
MKHRDVAALPPDLRFPVFEIVLRTTEGVDEYEDIVNYYRETYIPGEKVVALSVLGYGSSLELVRRTLAFAMSREVRTQDILSAIATLRSSVVGRAELWNFMRHHWDVLYERHCDDIGFLDYFVLLSIESFSTLERYREVQAFFANKDTSAYDRILATCLEGIRMNILWLERDCKDVEQWLKLNGYLNIGAGADGHERQHLSMMSSIQAGAVNGMYGHELSGHGISTFTATTPSTTNTTASSPNSNVTTGTLVSGAGSVTTTTSAGSTSGASSGASTPSSGLKYPHGGIYSQHATHVPSEVYLDGVGQASEEQAQQLLQLQHDQQQHELRLQQEYQRQLQLQQQQMQQYGLGHVHSHGHSHSHVHGHGHGHSHRQFNSRPPEQRPRTLEREMELLSMSGDYEF